MRKLLLIIIALFSFFLARSQNFHFIYIQLEDAMNYETVKKKLNTLINDIEKNNGKFVAFSNATPDFVATTKSEVQEIIKGFSTTSSFMSIVSNDELEVWLNVLENNEICRMDNGKMVLKNNLTSITFEMFVGDGFIESGMQNHILAKFLYASDLLNNITINYYNSSQLTEDKIQFNEIYKKNNLQIQLK